MKYRKIEIEDTVEGSPYLLMTHPTWPFDIRLFYSIRCKEARNGFRKTYHFDGTFVNRAMWCKNFDVYTLIPFHEERMLNRILRKITGDPNFYCDVLDHCDYIIMRF